MDTGFIVFNHATYPHLGRLFRGLDVAVERSDMSFAASLDGGRIEYALSDVRALLAQPRNALSPAFLAMLRDILRFNRGAEAAVREGQTIDGLVTALGLGESFRRLYLRPFCGAIWSMPGAEVDGFPATLLVAFLRNHGLLGLSGQHQWWTVSGGSRVYVDRLAARLAAGGVRIRAGAPVRSVVRDGTEVRHRLRRRRARGLRPGGARLPFRPGLAPSRGADRGRAQASRRDPLSPEPRRPACRRRPDAAAPRLLVELGLPFGTRTPAATVSVTYWMNRLQNLPEDDPLFVTLNPTTPIPEALVYDETMFDHPVFDAGTAGAQAGIAAIQGENRTWYAGAWLRNGFHEDGIASAMRVARAMNVPAW